MALTRHQREYRECNIMLFTETSLNSLIPDSHVSLGGFNLRRADKTQESGKKKGGGLCVFVNDSWCNSGHITVKEQHCCKNIELLAVGMRPYYLPWEFSRFCDSGIRSPSANGEIACDVLHSAVSRLQTLHPHASSSLEISNMLLPPPPCQIHTVCHQPHQRQ